MCAPVHFRQYSPCLRWLSRQRITTTDKGMRLTLCSACKRPLTYPRTTFFDTNKLHDNSPFGSSLLLHLPSATLEHDHVGKHYRPKMNGCLPEGCIRCVAQCIVLDGLFPFKVIPYGFIVSGCEHRTHRTKEPSGRPTVGGQPSVQLRGSTYPKKANMGA